MAGEAQPGHARLAARRTRVGSAAAAGRDPPAASQERGKSSMREHASPPRGLSRRRSAVLALAAVATADPGEEAMRTTSPPAAHLSGDAARHQRERQLLTSRTRTRRTNERADDQLGHRVLSATSRTWATTTGSDRRHLRTPRHARAERRYVPREPGRRVGVQGARTAGATCSSRSTGRNAPDCTGTEPTTIRPRPAPAGREQDERRDLERRRFGYEGLRLFDVTNPRTRTTCRFFRTECGSHTHTLVPDGKHGVHAYVASYPLGVADHPAGRLGGGGRRWA